jgi:broad specificity phosphatase PhoE
VDNERGIATGWKDGRLSEEGRADALRLGERRRQDGISAVFSSDLGRAVETVNVAFAGSNIPIYFDSRLRECNYGDWNGLPVAKIASNRSMYINQTYPSGQSYADVVKGVAAFLRDLGTKWCGHRVLIVGHTATKWALDYLLNGVNLEGLVDTQFEWREGWEYLIPAGW